MGSILMLNFHVSELLITARVYLQVQIVVSNVPVDSTLILMVIVKHYLQTVVKHLRTVNVISVWMATSVYREFASNKY
jgi:hypothetical protein